MDDELEVDDKLELKQGSNLAQIFAGAFLFSTIVIFVIYHFFAFEIAALAGICLLIATITTVTTGIENVLINDVYNQMVKLRAQVKGKDI